MKHKDNKNTTPHIINTKYTVPLKFAKNGMINKNSKKYKPFIRLIGDLANINKTNATKNAYNIDIHVDMDIISNLSLS